MVLSGVYDYVNVLDKAADGSWKRNQAIANNIANIDTPKYKRQDVSFQEELRHALKASKYVTLDEKVSNINKEGHLSRLEAKTYTDYGNYSYRLDGNNIDVDNENVELASNQLVYQGIISSVDAEFKNLKAVIK